MSAMHEAGHAALWSHLGVWLDKVWVRPLAETIELGDREAGGVVAGSMTVISLTGTIAAAAAGERAADRCLREAGLWTEERAWVIERHARHDRVYALKTLHDAGERLTFGERPGHPHDYATAQGAADRLLDELWQGVYRLADSLTQRRRLSGADVCRILHTALGYG